MENSEAMKIFLSTKQAYQFFWLRKIRDVDISKCCVKCFIGEAEPKVFHGTKYKAPPYSIEFDIEPSDKYVAYYLCGMSRGFVYENNTHVAFVNAPGDEVHIDNDKLELRISNARFIDFENVGYKPEPQGVYSDEQRTCRNWIFANYIKDGKVGG
jgi:hypothetical protein